MLPVEILEGFFRKRTSNADRWTGQQEEQTPLISPPPLHCKRSATSASIAASQPEGHAKPSLFSRKQAATRLRSPRLSRAALSNGPAGLRPKQRRRSSRRKHNASQAIKFQCLSSMLRHNVNSVPLYLREWSGCPGARCLNLAPQTTTYFHCFVMSSKTYNSPHI